MAVTGSVLMLQGLFAVTVSAWLLQCLRGC